MPPFWKSCFSTSSNVCHGFADTKKAPLSDEKVTVRNHDFVDVGSGIISMELVVLAMKESALFVPKVFSAAFSRPGTG